MNKKVYRSLLFVICIILFGCAAVGVPMTSDPAKKLRYAQSLFEEHNRPLPAESSIMEAMDIYRARKDEAGLANAYRIYALFLSSDAVANWGYQKNGFMDKTISFDNRFNKALEFFNHALLLCEKNSMRAEAANIYFNIGKLYFNAFDNKNLACKNFEMALQSNRKFREVDPETNVTLPSGFTSFEEFIKQAKSEAKCE